jgi:hypothetical protein
MTTLQTGPIITADKEVTARLTVSQWLGVVASIVLSAGFFYTSLNRLETNITDAAREAKAAAQDAAKALDQSSAVKAELQGALVNLSAKLGRIEGLLERLTQERTK